MAFADLQREQYERHEFQAARLAVMVRSTIGSLWGGEVLTEFDLLEWEDAEREAAEDAAFDADWEADLRRVQGHPEGH